MTFKTPVLIRTFLGTLFMIFALCTQVNAAMYKYITADGSTVLTGTKLQGKGNRLVKIYQIKDKGAYKNSLSKKAKAKKTNKKYIKRKKSHSRKSKKRRHKSLGKIAKANGRDNGIIMGCDNNFHLSKQARVYQKPIQIYSRIYNVDEELIHAIVRQESCFNEGAHSHVGAIGLMQLMPQTALGLKINDPWNPEHNIQGGIKYISEMLKRFKGNYKLAIAAYNAGPGNVRKYKGIPPFRETRKYVVKVYKEYKRLKKEGITYGTGIQVASN